MQSYPSPNALAADGGPQFYPQPSNQHHSSLSSPDDLQLTAQLSRGLAPVMNAGPGGAMPEGQDEDARTQDAINRQYEHEHDQQNPHEHVQLQANHGPMDQMGNQYAALDGSNAPRKRSKVSRACDECRRKKIRCDATGEPGDEQCSSCKRVGARCQFSRVPMKRGPSKGYIKELADRLNTLEGAMHAGEIPVGLHLGHPDNPVQRRASDEFSPPPHGETVPRKRTFSSLSGEFGTPYQAQKPPSGWTPQHPPNSAPPYTAPQPGGGAHQVFREPNYSPNGLQPAAQWRKPPELPRQSNSLEGISLSDSGQAEHSHDWDDGILNGYYNAIHPTYPILCQSKARLGTGMSNCHGPLKEAFYEALHAAVRSFTPPANQASSDQYSIKKATHLIIASQFENSSVRSFTTNLVYLQTMMLMAIAAENQPRKCQTGLSQSVWLGSAVGLSYSLKLHLHKQPSTAGGSDPDADENLARRIWWSLVIMDRWHSLSTSSPLLIPDGSVVVYPEDAALLGESLYHLARLSIILGHFAMANVVPTQLPALGTPPAQLVDTLLRGELERWRESLPAAMLPPSNAPLVHLCYWHLRILMELRLTDSDPHDLLTPAMHIVTQTTQNSAVATPLTYHCTTLAALSLLELTLSESTREEAERGLKVLLESPGPFVCDPAVRDIVSAKIHSSTAGTQKPPESQEALTASQGLQRLADIATATEGERDAATIDGRKEGDNGGAGTRSGAPPPPYQELKDIVRNGYLGILSADNNQYSGGARDPLS